MPPNSKGTGTFAKTDTKLIQSFRGIFVSNN